MIVSFLAASVLLGQGAPQTPPATTTAPAQSVKAAQDEARHQEDLKNDRESGKKYAEEVEKEMKLSKNTEYIERIQRIGSEIAKIANNTHAKATWGDKRMNTFDYTYKVIEGKDINAFSLPGGYIYVYEGLIKFAESDDELAGVLAHETAHAAFRHVATLVSQQSKISTLQLPIILAAIFTGGKSGTGDALLISQLLSQAKMSGWSVEAEEAADFGGFQYMLRSKYNPTGMLTFMERLALADRGSAYGTLSLGIYQTHPPSRERAETLTKDMQIAGVPIRRSLVTTTFRTITKPGDNGAIDVFFGKKKIASFAGADAVTRAEGAATQLNDFFDSTPEVFQLSWNPNGTISGSGKTLFQFAEEDAKEEGSPVEKLTSDAVSAIRVCLFSLGNRVWAFRT